MKKMNWIKVVGASLVAASASCGNGGRQNVETTAHAQQIISERWPDAVTTDSGLMYVVVQKGDGGAKPKQGNLVKAHYTGKLLNGTEFDSSVKRGQPLAFTVGVGQVIKGWDEAFLDMTKGEKRVIIIPSELGYGVRGAGRKIPPNATLVFDVELVDF